MHVREYEPELAFPPTLKLRLAAGDPYLSAKQVAFLAKCLRTQDRGQLADAIEAAFHSVGSFSPTDEEKVELLRIVRLWSHDMRADHRVEALLACLQRDTGQSSEPPKTAVIEAGRPMQGTGMRSATRILRVPAASLSQIAGALTDFLK